MKTKLLLLSVSCMLGVAIAACDTENATTAVIDNHAADTLYRAWWVTTYFDVPVAAGATSESLRAVPVTGTAYALLAPGWDAASTTAPTAFAVRQSRAPLTSTRGQELHISVSEDAYLGGCSAPLSEEDRTYIVERIFPGELTTTTYDPTTCQFRPTPSSIPDASTDADL